jgi:hypothetical protein
MLSMGSSVGLGWSRDDLCRLTAVFSFTEIWPGSYKLRNSAWEDGSTNQTSCDMSSAQSAGSDIPFGTVLTELQ